MEARPDSASRRGWNLHRAAPASGARLSGADGWREGAARREGCGHDGQRMRVAQMQAATDPAFGRVIEGKRSGRALDLRNSSGPAPRPHLTHERERLHSGVRTYDPKGKSRCPMTRRSILSATKSGTCSPSSRIAAPRTPLRSCAHTFFSSICIAARLAFYPINESIDES
jgi:hypothetical protein